MRALEYLNEEFRMTCELSIHTIQTINEHALTNTTRKTCDESIIMRVKRSYLKLSFLRVCRITPRRVLFFMELLHMKVNHIKVKQKKNNTKPELLTNF